MRTSALTLPTIASASISTRTPPHQLRPHERIGREDFPEPLAVGASDRLPVLQLRGEDARAHHVVEARAERAQRPLDLVDDEVRLRRGVGPPDQPIAVRRRRPRHEVPVPVSDGSRVPVLRLPRRPAQADAPPGDAILHEIRRREVLR
jgi:hypothetical protein